MSLQCSCCVEWLNVQGTVLKRFKSATVKLTLTRNDFRDIFINLTADKGIAHKFAMKDIAVHKRFLSDGKTTINFKSDKVMMMISNAPVAQLTDFLKVLFIKVTGRKESPQVKIRERLLAVKSSSTEEISPINQKDVGRVDAKLEGPMKKRRKLETDLIKHGVDKKSPMTNLKDKLTGEQQEVINAVKANNNIFFTGSAGTGKSFLLRYIVSTLPPDTTMVTASTGASACLISGVTLHSFAGIGNGDCTVERGIQMASKSPNVQVWRKCKILIIDEISMIDGEYFEKLNKVAKAVRNRDEPFGGIKLVLCGDFLQLPPVKQGKNRFCFQTSTWSECRFRCFNLRFVHRQSDNEFIKILNHARLGNIDPNTAIKLKSTSFNLLEKDGIAPTRLCCRTAEALMINRKKLFDLPGKEYKFEAFDSGSTKTLDDHTPVEKMFVLKPGAQVMLLKNISVSSGLVNGARGVVKSFDKNGSPVVQFKCGNTVPIKTEKWIIKTPTGQFISRQQIPLKLAWAFSIHKSQGLTLDCVEISLGQVFEAGQAYVALSRAKSLETLRILDFDKKHVWANPDVISFYNKLDRIIKCDEIYTLGK